VLGLSFRGCVPELGLSFRGCVPVGTHLWYAPVVESALGDFNDARQHAPKSCYQCKAKSVIF
jgi:hypothetical protein